MILSERAAFKAVGGHEGALGVEILTADRQGAPFQVRGLNTIRSSERIWSLEDA